MTTLTDAQLANIPNYTDGDARYEFPEPPLTLYATVHEEREEHDVLVYRLLHQQYNEGTDPTPGQRARIEGRVFRIRPAVNRAHGWFVGTLGLGNRFYAEATKLNPEPVVGHCYRMISGGGFLLRYEEDGRWGIVRGAGHNPWMAGDHLVTNPTAYYEVADPDAAAPEVPDVRDNPLDEERFHNRAEVTNGHIQRVTEFEDGSFYVGYDPDGDRNKVFYGVKLQGRDNLLHWGSYHTRWGSEIELPEYEELPANAVWAKALITPPYRSAAIDQAVVLANFTAETERLNTRWEEFNDALNELAQEEGWCSEYERIMAELGMRSRRAGRIRLEVDVVVDVNVTVDSPHYRINSAVEMTHSVTPTDLSFNGQITVPVQFVLDRDNDYSEGFDEDMDASDYISRDDIDAAVDERIDDASFTIEDWNIDGDVRAADNQDDLT